MNEIVTLEEKLIDIRKEVIDVLEKNAPKSIYTTISRLYRLEGNIRTIIENENISQEEKNIIFLAFYVQNIESSDSKLKSIDFDKSESTMIAIINKLSSKYKIDKEIVDSLIVTIKESFPTRKTTRIESKILRDAQLMDYSCELGRDHLKQRYEEMVLRDFKIPESSWYETMIGFTNNTEAFTIYGKEYIQQALESLNKRLKKEKKDIENRASLIIKKELNISEMEIKKLKKDIEKVKNRDERGIQTLFRTTIKNHYTLNEMVDKKASIMITVNSIILSLVMGGIIGETGGFNITMLPIIFMSFTSILSIIFAVIAIRPTLTQGDFTEEEIRSKNGNLLYFGNFFNMHFRDFEWGFLQMLNDKNYLYGSMIRDYYYQGIGLSRKYKFIHLSLTVFLFGFGISFISFSIIKLMFI